MTAGPRRVFLTSQGQTIPRLLRPSKCRLATTGLNMHGLAIRRLLCLGSSSPSQPLRAYPLLDCQPAPDRTLPLLASHPILATTASPRLYVTQHTNLGCRSFPGPAYPRADAHYHPIPSPAVHGLGCHTPP